MRTVTHPGPVAGERQELLPAAGRPVALTLRPDMSLEDAVADAMAAEGLDGAWLELRDAPVAALEYVIPAPSPDAAHVAWYSDIRSFTGPGHIHHLGMMVGRDGAASFIHGHGLWSLGRSLGGSPGKFPAGPGQPEMAMGHILAPRSRLSAPTLARGIGVSGACFTRRPDPETGFTLFRPARLDMQVQGADAYHHALLRLAPNQDFAAALDLSCARLGWKAARVHGLGSLIGAMFEGGSVLDSLPTEFLILDAEARAGAETAPEIAIVGIDGSDIRRGRLRYGRNAVLITAEIVLERC